MDLEARFDLFGNPSETLAAESVWALREREGRWPSWEEALAYLSEWEKISVEQTDRRIVAAIRDGEIVAKLDEDVADFFLELGEGMEERIQRRYLDMTLKREGLDGEAWQGET